MPFSLLKFNQKCFDLSFNALKDVSGIYAEIARTAVSIQDFFGVVKGKYGAPSFPS